MKKRSFIAAIAMLVVSAIVLTSATFAWFTMGETVTVTSFNASVTQADGLTISADGQNFAASVSLDDIIAAANNGSNAVSIVSTDGQLFPVSTNGVSTVYAAHLEGDNVKVDGEADTGKYYDFPLWIKYMGDGSTTVNLSGTSIANGSSNASGKDPVKAARLACYPYTSTSAPKVFIPSATSGETYNYLTNGSSRTLDALADTTTDASAITLTLNSREALKVRVRIWLEGEDAQCTDALAAGGQLAISMTFSKAS